MTQKNDTYLSRTSRVGKSSRKDREGSLFRNMIDGAVRLAVCFDEKGHVADFTVLEVNRAWEKITGISRVESCPRGKL